MKNRFLLSFLCSFVAFAVSAAPLSIVRPLCESAVDPIGVVRSEPRFSWGLAGETGTTRPAAAELRLAVSVPALSDPARVLRHVFSTNLFAWVYNGSPLDPDTRYWWQVRLTDAAGKGVTDWSAPSHFSLALSPEDSWNGARWISPSEEPSRVCWTNFDLTVRFLLDKKALGVLFRASDAACGYLWQFNAEESVPRLRPHVLLSGGAIRHLPAVSLARVFPSGIVTNQPITMQIETRGTRIRTRINGVCVDTREDTTFRTGTIGLRAVSGERARVEELIVKDSSGHECLHDRFRGHFMPAFRAPALADDRLLVANRVYLHENPLPKNTPRLRRTFSLADKPIRRAVVSSVGLGAYELYVNGTKADASRILSPGMTNPSRAVLFDTFDVTSFLRSGTKNTLGLWLAPGYSDDFSRYGWHWLKPPQAIVRLSVTYTDGTRAVIVSDGEWTSSRQSPILSASLYHGEIYDAALETPSWAAPDGPADGWKPVRVCPADGQPRLRANPAPAIRLSDPRAPVKITETAPGVFVADFGQNRAGFVSVRAKGPKGTRIRIRTSELVGADGSIDPWTNTSAKSADTFLLAGTGETEEYIPRFTYHGFRYAEITGFPGRPAATNLTGWATHADVRPLARFHCSNDGLNRLWSAATWSMLSNFMSYPTDCCMRSERTPCQMDSQVYEDTACRFFDMTGFYEKWLDDISGARGGNPDWTGDGVTLPWRLWTFYGDRRILIEQYDSVKNYIDALMSTHPDFLFKTGFGDWCAPNKGTWDSFFNDVEIVNTSLFCDILARFSKTAAVLGRSADAAFYAAKAAAAREAFHAAYYHPETASYGDGSQTTAVLPLAFDLVPQKDRSAVSRRLVETIRTRNGSKIDTGIFGTRYIGDVLCDFGESDLFVHLLTQPEYPGFGFMFARGATTLWEQWTFRSGMNSHNHAMFSGVVGTLLSRLGGIRPAAPGYAEVEIAPVFPRQVSFVEASCETPRGVIDVSWRRVGTQVRLDITVPPLTPAVLRLPGKSPVLLKEGRQTRLF